MSEQRQLALRNLDRIFDEAKQAFARWNILGKRLKEVFRKAIVDDTAYIKEGPKIRPRHRSRDKDKVSTNDAKSLKPEMLETNLPPLQIMD